jgi:hypothetical protein
MQRLKSALTALAVGLVLLTALDYAASAATGRSMVLGHWNQADHKTVLKNTKQGVALDLRTKNGPVLKVNNSKRIKKLNADRVDGLNASQLRASRQNIYLWGTASHTGGFSQAVPAQAPGSYLMSYSIQLVGAAGTVANPNTIACRVVVATLVGTQLVTKAIVGETTVKSVGTPPSLSGSGAVILTAGDQLRFGCSMTREDQKWSTTATQPIQVSFLHTDGSNVLAGLLGKTTLHKKG